MELTVFEQVSVAAEEGASVSLAFEPIAPGGLGRLLVQVRDPREGPSMRAAALSKDEAVQWCAMLQQVFAVDRAARRVGSWKMGVNLVLDSLLSRLSVSYSNRGEPYREGMDIVLTLAGREYYAFVGEDAITQVLIPTLKRWLALGS